jgi:hypothetical protein
MKQLSTLGGMEKANQSYPELDEFIQDYNFK